MTIQSITTAFGWLERVIFIKHVFRLLLLVALPWIAQATQVQYSYDSLNRLTNVDYGNGSVISYTYDPAGNRLTYSGAVANDTIAPNISITTPTTGQTLTTSNAIINLSGTASDDRAEERRVGKECRS